MRIDRNTKIYLGQREIVKIKKGNVVIWESQSTPPVVEPDYFYVQNISDQSGNLSLHTSVTGTPSSGNYATTVEYSTDKENWTTLNLSNGVTHTITLQVGEKVYFRNDSGKWNYWTGDDNVTDSVITNFSFEYDHNVGGNINTLLDYTSPNTAALSTGCFAYLFKDVANLVLAKYLTLPATTLAPHCYRSMFNGCTDLIYGPQLPATTMAEGCYRFMFYNCSSMHYAPALPATTLATKCYHTMFYGCSRITEAPTLSVTTLAPYCYDSMFQYCTALETAPALPATTLTPYCYYEMFRGCSSLEVAPTLPAQTLAQNCYQGMFKYCSSLNRVTTYANNVSAADCITDWLLDVAPTGIVHNLGTATYTANSVSGIPTGWIEDGYFYMENISQNDTNLNIRVIGSTEHATDYTTTLEYSRDKSTWTTLDLSNEGNHYLTFNAGDKIYFRNDNGKFNQNVNSTRSISFISDEDNATGGSVLTLGNYRDIDNFEMTEMGIFGNIFEQNTHLKDASHLVISRTSSYSYTSMFNGCTSLTTAPALPATTLANYCYRYMFGGCSSLVNAPELPATTLAEDCYSYMFSKCTSLVNAPALPATTLANYCYQGMFERCSALVNPPSILPGEFYYDNWNSYSYCYSYMFQYCTALENPPILPVTKLGEGCYQYMFLGCRLLLNAPALPATTLANYCYQDMFAHCIRLDVAPELPATTLAQNCYQEMFYGCSRLKQVITYANDISAADCITDWLLSVNQSGTFYNLGTATYTQDSGSGIPQGWTEDTTAPVYNNYYAIPDTFTAKSWMDTVKITYGLYAFYDGYYVPISVETGKTSIGKNTGNTTRTMSVNVSDSQLRWVTVTINQTANDTDEPDYFYIENNSDQDSLGLNVQGYAGSYFSDYSKITESLEYSLDKNTWNSIDFTQGSITTNLTVPVNGKVYFRNDTGKFGYYADDTERYSISFESRIGNTAHYSVGGDIRTLLNYMDIEKTKPTANGTFAYLFVGGDYLTDASNLKLQTTLPSKYCYYNMFNNSTALEAAPELPAKTMTECCYREMFNGCTALTSAPALPATTLENNCYESMFSNCSQLKNPPVLPATTLAGSCYKYMFQNSGLIFTPELPATTLAFGCYDSMFAGSSVKYTSELPATTLTNSCYKNMFQVCSALVNPPALPATILIDSCYESMFDGCTALTVAPELPANSVNSYNCYGNMFSGCTSLNSVTILATSIGSDATTNWLLNVAAEGTFNNVGFATYTSGPSGIPSGWTEVTPTITSITASPNTYTLKSYQKSVTINPTLTVVTNVGTFTMNDSQIITVGENTGDSTRTLTETIPYKSSSYQITIVQTANDPKPAQTWSVVSTGTYPFQLNSNDYYESTNKGHDNTYSYATLTYEGFNELVLQCINSGESNYDYGTVSQPDQTLSESISDDGATGSTVVFHNFKGESSTSPVTLTIPSDGAEHFITIKYRKDSSMGQSNDSLQFKVVEPTT